MTATPDMKFIPDHLDLAQLRELRPAAGLPRLRPGLFVDLEGALVESTWSPGATALPQFLPGAGRALARLQRTGLALVVVTNQSGLSRGRFTRAEFARSQRLLLDSLQAEFGVQIDSVEVCPHGPDSQGRPACLCRTPAPGMLTRAAQRLRLDLKRSWMVGTTMNAVEAGHRAGAGGLLLDGGTELPGRRSPLREPDACLPGWPALADHVEKLADVQRPAPAPLGIGLPCG
jgi:D-glycero-D-manno-heptose 1,7-bisphosphate phosphatase